MQKVRYQLKFTGRVQGVGFRYTANTIAISLGITGWVRNEWDGSVLLEAQGTEKEISTLIDRLGSGSFIEIDNVEKTVMAVVENEQSFWVRY